MSGKTVAGCVVLVLGLAVALAIRVLDEPPPTRPGEPESTALQEAEGPPPASRTDRAATPTEQPAPSPPPADPESAPRVPPATILRVQCVLPEGLLPTTVSAWFRDHPDDTNLRYPATVAHDIVTVRAPHGQGQLSVQVEGCVVERWMVDAPDGCTTDLGPFALRRAVPLAGRVVDEEGRPVTDAFVYPKVGDRSVPLQGTDEEGRFVFDGLPEGEAILRVESETMVRRIVRHEHSAEGPPVQIVLRHGVLLRGIVIDASGAPVDAVYASVVDTAAPNDRSRMAFPSIEDDGTFEVQLLPGDYSVRVHHDGMASSEVIEIRAGRPVSLTLRLSP